MNSIKSFLFFLLFTALCAGAVFGVLDSKHAPVASIGPFQITTSENGLSLMQNNANEYFYFSPYQDSITYSTGEKTGLITSDDIKNKNVSTYLPTSKWDVLFKNAENYFGFSSPHMEFVTDKKISYSSEITSQKLTVKRTVVLKKGKIPKGDMSLSFNSGDFVFDKTGKLYSYIDSETKDLFEKTYRITLSPTLEDLYPRLSEKTVFIYSPKLSGVIAVKAQKNQTIVIDRNARTIHVEEAPRFINGSYEDSITIHILNTIKEAWEAK